jgi:hypothetical protein
LIGCGLGECVDLDVGVLVADSVAGQGAQVVEQSLEAAQYGSVGCMMAGGFGLGCRRALRGRDRVVALWGIFIGWKSPGAWGASSEQVRVVIALRSSGEGLVVQMPLMRIRSRAGLR